MAAVEPAAPLLRPTSSELAAAPELGVLAAVDATLATAVYQLQSGHPELGLEALALGHVPSREARKAGVLIFRFTDLRVAIREYREIALGQEEPPF